MTIDVEIDDRIYTARLNPLGELELFDADGNHASPDIYAQVDEWELTQMLEGKL
jgi:hypothetical protein